MRKLSASLMSGAHSFAFLACLLMAPAFLGQRATANPQDYHSLKFLRARIAELRSQHQDDKDLGRIGKKSEDESLDYLEALEAYLAPRAYPNDTVDWEALKGAAAKRDAMPAYKSRTIQPSWNFLGPSNCSSPSQWAFGPGKVSGRIASAAFDATNPLVYYVASAGGGAWKTSDGGTTWKPLGDGWTNIPTSCVAVDQQFPNNIYVGTGDWDGWGGYSQGIERSTDGGNTWVDIGQAQFGNYAVRRILIDPDNDQILTVVTGRGESGNGQVWRSTDKGNNWAPVITTAALWSDIVCSAPDNQGNRAYYAVAGGQNSQLWKSVDRGMTWSRLTAPLRSGVSVYDTADIAASPTNPGTIYLLGTGDQKVWKSTNGGSTWVNVTGANLTSADWGQAWYDFYITCSTSGGTDVLYVGLIDILQSPDAGASWHSFMNGYTGSDLAHVDEHDLVVDPLNPNHLLTCCDGGVYTVNVNGSAGSFTSLNAGLGVTEFYYGDFHPTDSNRMIGGAQDNGTPASLSNFNFWQCISGGDGGAALMNQTNPNIQYSTYQYFGGSYNGGTIGFNRTANNWASSSWISVNAGSDSVSWMGPAVLGATNSGVMYVATNYLYKYTDSSNSWTSRLGSQKLSSSSTISSIGVTKADQTVLYTGSYDGQLYVSRNSGSNWAQINTGTISLPNRSYTSISVRDDNANDLLVGLSGTGADHLWRCFDSSAGTRTWVDVSGQGVTGLPDIPVNAIARDPADPIDIWYVGTDIGVFETQNAGNTWQNITQPLGLPNVQVTGLCVRNDFLYAVTYGRGMWNLDLSQNGGNGGNLTMVGLGLNPTAVVGPAPSTGTVTISGPAPQGGIAVALASDNPTDASVPSTVTVPAGQTSANFQVTTIAVPSQAFANITASLNNTNAAATLTINPNGLTSLSLNPVSVIGGNPSQGMVQISVPAGNGGSIVHLSSSNTSVATVPTTVTIPQGGTSANFTVTTIPTGTDTNVVITATLGTSQVQGTLTVNAATVQTFSLNPTNVVGGNPVQGTVTLNGRAPSGGAVIPLLSSNTSIATVPASVTIPSGSTTATFVVTTLIVPLDSGVTISESYHGIERQADLLVGAQKVTQLQLTPDPAVGGNIVTGKVVLAGPATSNTIVQLSATNATYISMPTSVTVPRGQTQASFTITTHTVSANILLNIFAVLGGSSVETDLTLLPLQLAGLSLSSNSVFEHATVIGTVTLNGPALSGGAVVQITNSNSQAATMPASVTIPQGQVSKSFTINALSVSSVQITTITAQRNGVSFSQNLAVTPISIDSISLNYNQVIGGTTVSGVVRLGAAAPTGGYVVHLSTSYPTVVHVPATITVPAGSNSATFTATTTPVPQTDFVQITATHNAFTASTQLEVDPPEVSTFHVSPTTIRGGGHVTGTVTLTGRAPTGGMLITINANPFLAWPAGTVQVNAGSTSVSFTIDTSTVTQTTPVTLTAIALSVPVSTTLTITP